jgi:cell division protein FtsI/penicillin-binding protein 2
MLYASRHWDALNETEKSIFRFIEAHAPRGTTYDRAVALLAAEKKAGAAALEKKITARLSKK